MPTSPQLSATLQRAFVYAEEQAHRQVTAEHLLLALTEDGDAAAVLQRKGIDLDQMRNEVAGLVSRNNDRFEATEPGQPAYGADLLRVLSTASGAASARRPIDGALVLAALIADGTTPSAEVIKLFGLTFDDITRLPPPPPVHAPPLASVRATAREMALGMRTRRQPAPAEQPTRSEYNPRRVEQPDEPPAQGWNGAPRPPTQRRTLAQDPGFPPPGGFAEEGINGFGHVPPAADDRGQAEGFSSLATAALPPEMAPRPPAGFAQEADAGWDGYSYPEPETDPRLQAPPAWHEAEPRQQPQQQSPRYSEPATARGRQPRTNAAAANGQPKTQGRKGAGKGRRKAERSPLIENIPRRLVVGTAQIVEVHMARQDIELALRDAHVSAGPQDLPVTQAITVRLRAPDAGIMIEVGSPETLWIESLSGLHQDDFASWRWTVHPKWSGGTHLQFVACTHVLGPDGLATETALPDQIVEVNVAANHAARLRGIALWGAVAGAAAGLGALVEHSLHLVGRLIGH